MHRLALSLYCWRTMLILFLLTILQAVQTFLKMYSTMSVMRFVWWNNSFLAVFHFTLHSLISFTSFVALLLCYVLCKYPFGTLALLSVKPFSYFSYLAQLAGLSGCLFTSGSNKWFPSITVNHKLLKATANEVQPLDLNGRILLRVLSTAIKIKQKSITRLYFIRTPLSRGSISGDSIHSLQLSPEILSSEE